MSSFNEIDTIIKEYSKIKLPLPIKEQLEKISQTIEAELPDEVKYIYSITNGGYIRPERIFRANDQDIVFNSIDSIEHIQLLLENEIGVELLKHDLLPFADDIFGNLICIKFKGIDKGKVYFQDHELNNNTDSILEPMYLADSISEFLRNLKSQEDYEKYLKVKNSFSISFKYNDNEIKSLKKFVLGKTSYNYFLIKFTFTLISSLVVISSLRAFTFFGIDLLYALLSTIAFVALAFILQIYRKALTEVETHKDEIDAEYRILFTLDSIFVLIGNRDSQSKIMTKYITSIKVVDQIILLFDENLNILLTLPKRALKEEQIAYIFDYIKKDL